MERPLPVPADLDQWKARHEDAKERLLIAEMDYEAAANRYQRVAAACPCPHRADGGPATVAVGPGCFQCALCGLQMGPGVNTRTLF